tara:strand:+ start:72 stop:368 length:297 start_codon:yes stop_codon:yes gene_type:complete
MADSLQQKFDTDGSPLAVPVSPANGVTPDSVSIVGNSTLHNEYSNIGNPDNNAPAYNNFGAGAIGYSTPETSRQGLASEKYQRKVNRYRNNLPPGASF